MALKTDGKRYTMQEIREMYPDQWVILDDCEWENRSTVKNAVVVDVCNDDEISAKRIQNRHGGKHYIYERTTEGIFSPYVHAVDYEVRV